jgi:hypothetical protein
MRFSQFASRVARHEGQTDNVDQDIENSAGVLQQLTNVVVLTASQDARLNAVERRVDRIE